MQQVSANGVEFAYIEDGPADGPLALCLHGFPDVADTWNGLLPLLAEAGFHAVAPFMRGYPPTGFAPAGNYHAVDLGLDALALADALAGDADPPVIVGHDWGALATWIAVAHRPDRFARAVAMSVPHPVTVTAVLMDPAVIKAGWYQHFFQRPIAENVVANDDLAFIEFLWHDWSPGRPPDPAHVRKVKDCLASPEVLEAAIGYYRATLGGVWEPVDDEATAAQAAFLAPVQVPTLYLHGGIDPIYDPRIIDEDATRAFVADLEIGIIEGAGHFLHLERPDDVQRRILDFLTRS